MEHSRRQDLEDYRKKLVVSSGPLPDPFTLAEWTTQRYMEQWPPITLHTMAEYLKPRTTPELYHRICDAYKQYKECFTDNYLEDIDYHPIHESSPVAFLTADVKRMSSAKPFYQVWVAVKKATDTEAGGTIESAYCTCTAGLLGACSHIASVLLRVEYFVRTTLPPLTSEQIMPISKILRKQRRDLIESTAIHPKGHQQSGATPRPAKKKRRKYPKSDDIVREFAESLKEHCPESCFAQLYYGKPFP